MRGTLVLVSAALVAIGAAACSVDDDEQPPTESVSMVPSAEPTEPPPGMDGTPLPEPTPVAGSGVDEIEAAVEKFAIHFACYRTFAQQPQREWFDSWADLATEEFVQQQRVAFVDTWSWAWNTETQVIGCQRGGDIEVSTPRRDTAIARITIDRYLFHADSRVGDSDEDSTTFDVAVELNDRRIPEVYAAVETDRERPFPPSLTSMGR